MALTTCPACRGQISRDASTCPHCGKQLHTAARIVGAIPGVLTLLTLAYFLHMCSAPRPKPPPPPPSPAAVAACRADIKCAGEGHALDASIACRRALEARANYAARWPDDLPTWTYSEWQDETKRAIVYLGDRLQLQNGFGAWQNHIYSCTYDPDAKRVIAVYLAPGRI